LPQVGLQNQLQIDKKSIPKSITKLMHLGIDFWKDFHGFWERKWSQVGTKIVSHMRFPENTKKAIWS